jgi:hypothetical protein
LFFKFCSGVHHTQIYDLLAVLAPVKLEAVMIGQEKVQVIFFVPIFVDTLAGDDRSIKLSPWARIRIHIGSPPPVCVAHSQHRVVSLEPCFLA